MHVFANYGMLCIPGTNDIYLYSSSPPAPRVFHPLLRSSRLPRRQVAIVTSSPATRVWKPAESTRAAASGSLATLASPGAVRAGRVDEKRGRAQGWEVVRNVPSVEKRVGCEASKGHMRKDLLKMGSARFLGPLRSKLTSAY